MNKIYVSAGAVLAASVTGAAWLMNANPSAQSTDDAYVEGNIIQVTPQVGGSVTMIAADNTDFVKAGEPLLRLNDVDAQLAVSRAEAQLSRAVRQVRVQFANATQGKANVTLRATDLARVQADLARRRQLASSGAVSGEDVHHAEDAVKAAQAALDVAQQQLASSQALVDKTTISDHPDVQAAISQLRDAYVAANRTTVRAPASGYVSKRNVQIGQRINAGSAVMSIVPPDQMWVNANFKESQLRQIHIGQPVQLVADVYGKSVRYTGRVIGQEAGTGSAFALLPAQNASGNWIKVIQRVPVRIALDPKELAAHPLKLGLSMHVEVDTSQPGNPSVKAANTVYSTDVFEHEMQDADAAVARIIAANVGTGQLAKVN
ncbi:efflux RND transporter periplasmic adaptor subunit [Pseudoduganella sp. RAF19]|uniref:HlyD family secretion protein n=1 Tax=Pseudoduganella sp. RAF19 TaxID=3233052 RepID=UPI003F9D7562